MQRVVNVLVPAIFIAIILAVAWVLMSPSKPRTYQDVADDYKRQCIQERQANFGPSQYTLDQYCTITATAHAVADLKREHPEAGF